MHNKKYLFEKEMHTVISGMYGTRNKVDAKIPTKYHIYVQR